MARTVKPSTGLWEDSIPGKPCNADAKESAIPVNQRVQERTSCERNTDNSPGKAGTQVYDCTTCGGAKVVPSGDRRGTKTCPTCGGTERNNSKPERGEVMVPEIKHNGFAALRSGEYVKGETISRRRQILLLGGTLRTSRKSRNRDRKPLTSGRCQICTHLCTRWRSRFIDLLPLNVMRLGRAYWYKSAVNTPKVDPNSVTSTMYRGHIHEIADYIDASL